MTFTWKVFKLYFVEKAVIIVTDEAESTGKMAEAIAAELKNFKIVSVTAKDFSGTDLLAASIIFFGAERNDPPSFTYLNKMLQHINLAGRSCGIFSPSKQAAEYLCGMVRDSEITVYPDLFLGEGDIKTWVKKVTTAL